MLATYRLVNLWIVSMLVSTTVALFPGTVGAAEFLQLPDGSKLDLTRKCPVCGMVVGGKNGQAVTVSYKDGRIVGFGGVAAAVFKDGHVVGFEGARCLFIYNSVPEKYNVKVSDIAHQYVTDFVSKKVIELPKAFLVLGSNVKGPMGYDLIPFSDRDAAAKFASVHDGKWIVRLQEVAKAAQEETGKTEEAEKEGSSVLPAPAQPSPVEPQGTSSQGTRTLPQDTDESARPRGGHHMMHMH